LYSIEAEVASTTPNVSACIQPQRGNGIKLSRFRQELKLVISMSAEELANCLLINDVILMPLPQRGCVNSPEGVKKLILGFFARYESTTYSRKNDRF
jgi:hypothetical protein